MTKTKALWQDYLFLTQEIERFFNQKEYDLCLELLNQREAVQSLLDKAEDDFRLTAEGRKLLSAVQDSNGRISQGMQMAMRLMKRRQAVADTYDGYADGAPMGNRLDQQS